MKTNNVLSSMNTWLGDWRNAFLPSLLERVQLARESVNEFAALCCTDSTGKAIRQAVLHRELQGFLDQNHRALVELPRDHGKSVQICLRILWELGHDPSLRVKIVCASDAMAIERCRFLRDAIAYNRWLHLVFPDLKPAQPWGATRFTIQRPANVIGPSVAALGVGSVATGTRADLLVCDDIVDVKSLRSRADRERVKSYFHENLMNLLEPNGRFWGLFTPWHIDDLNSNLKRNPAYALFRRAVGDNLEPVWAEKWNSERLEERRREIGTLSFARAYRLVCVPEEDVPIRGEWVRYWVEGDGTNWTDGTDGKHGGGEPRRSPATHGGGEPRRSLAYEQVVLAVDPAVSTASTADRTALVTLGRTGNNEIHCLEALARRVTAPALMALIDDADRRWQPEVILFESNAAFAGIRDLLVKQARFGPKIKSVVQTKDKMSRVHAFSVPVENGTFRLRGEGERETASGRVHRSQQELFDEMTSFPFGEHDDLLDAAGSGVAEMMGRREMRVW